MLHEIRNVRMVENDSAAFQFDYRGRQMVFFASSINERSDQSWYRFSFDLRVVCLDFSGRKRWPVRLIIVVDDVSSIHSRVLLNQVSIVPPITTRSSIRFRFAVDGPSTYWKSLDPNDHCCQLTLVIPTEEWFKWERATTTKSHLTREKRTSSKCLWLIIHHSYCQLFSSF